MTTQLSPSLFSVQHLHERALCVIHVLPSLSPSGKLFCASLTSWSSSVLHTPPCSSPSALYLRLILSLSSFFTLSLSRSACTTQPQSSPFFPPSLLRFCSPPQLFVPECFCASQITKSVAVFGLFETIFKDTCSLSNQLSLKLSTVKRTVSKDSGCASNSA